MTTSVMTASAEEILAATAHELRLPLSHIKGFVSSLQRTDVEWDEQTRREFITEIDLATDHLTGLVDSLLAARAPGADGKPCPDMTFTSSRQPCLKAHSTELAYLENALCGSTSRQLCLRSG